MSEKSTRSRGPNFCKEEQILLFDIMEPFMGIIECKKTDSVRQVDKHQAWAKITEIFNANTKKIPRDKNTLLHCYRNSKSKIKKQHSGSKMLLEDLEGGGPPSPKPSSEDPLERIKIEPQIDGLYTIYDSDANRMAQYQETLPEDECIESIDKEDAIQDTPKLIKADRLAGLSRTEIMKKRKPPALCNYDDKIPTTIKKRKINLPELYKDLSEEKKDLVRMQKKLLQMEIDHKKQIYQLELVKNEIQLQDLKSEIKHREEMRQKEIILMDKKIKKCD